MDSNQIKLFISDRLVKSLGDRIPVSKLYSSYLSWAKDNDYSAVSNIILNKEISNNIEKIRKGGIVYFYDIAFKPKTPLIPHVIPSQSSLIEVVNPPISYVSHEPKTSLIPRETPSQSSLIEVINPPISYVSHEPVIHKKVFIKFTDFILHVPSYIGIKGSFSDDIGVISSYPFSLEDVYNLVNNTDINKLSITDSAHLYTHFNDLLNEITVHKLSLENSVVLIFSSGNNYSQFQFRRNLLICDTYDEFYSYCKNQSLAI